MLTTQMMLWNDRPRTECVKGMGGVKGIGYDYEEMTALEVARHWEDEECVPMMEVRVKQHGRVMEVRGKEEHGRLPRDT